MGIFSSKPESPPPTPPPTRSSTSYSSTPYTFTSAPSRETTYRPTPVTNLTSFSAQNTNPVYAPQPIYYSNSTTRPVQSPTSERPSLVSSSSSRTSYPSYSTSTVPQYSYSSVNGQSTRKSTKLSASEWPSLASNTPQYSHSSASAQNSWDKKIPKKDLGQRSTEISKKIILPSTKNKYASKEEYVKIMKSLVKAEENSQRQIAEEWIVRNAPLMWSQEGNFYEGKLQLSEDEKKSGNIALETKLRISYGSWIIEASIDFIDDEELIITAERDPKNPVPTFNGKFKVEQIFNDIAYKRMIGGLDRFLGSTSMSSEISSIILGDCHPYSSNHSNTTIDTSLLSSSKFELNDSQRRAATEALGDSPMYLILGPPGTGKTKTSVAIIAQLANHIQTKGLREKILVCAPSNTAIDDLALKLYKAGVEGVTRMYSSSKENSGKMNPELKPITLFHKILQRSSEFKALHNKRFKGEYLSEKEKKQYISLKTNLKECVLRESKIVCCTCSTAGDQLLSLFAFKTVFIDEASQSIEPETLIPFTLGAQRVILTGDHNQLGPVITCSEVKAAGLGRALFERVINLVHNTMLECQYRMHPLIAEFPSRTFYQGKLKTHASVEERHNKQAIPTFLQNPLRFFNIEGMEEESGTSSMNKTEAGQVEKVLNDLLKSGVKPQDIGIITPYIGQKGVLQKNIHKNRGLKEIKIASVDEYQGGEKNYIIISTVRTKKIGFLSDERRLNVSITRARFGMIICGNSDLLMQNKHWGKLIQFYKDNGSFYEGVETIYQDDQDENLENQNEERPNDKKGTGEKNKGSRRKRNQKKKKNVDVEYVPKNNQPIKNKVQVSSYKDDYPDYDSQDDDYENYRGKVYNNNQNYGFEDYHSDYGYV